MRRRILSPPENFLSSTEVHLRWRHIADAFALATRELQSILVYLIEPARSNDQPVSEDPEGRASIL
jgi:hypothetical protein